MYGNAQSYTTPNGMVAEFERREWLAELAAEAKKTARVVPTDDDLLELSSAIRFADSAIQDQWLEWLDDDSEENAAMIADYVLNEFHRMRALMTKPCEKAFRQFELDYII